MNNELDCIANHIMKRLYHIANRFCMLTNNNNDGHFTLDFHVSWSLDSTCNKSCYTPTLTMVRVNTLHPSTYLAVHVRHPSWLECQRRGGFQESFQAAGSLWRFVVLVKTKNCLAKQEEARRD